MSNNRCEFVGCKRRATQADCYLNCWLCTDHYSQIGRLTDDYQAPTIDWDLLEQLTNKGVPICLASKR